MTSLRAITSVDRRSGVALAAAVAALVLTGFAAPAAVAAPAARTTCLSGGNGPTDIADVDGDGKGDVSYGEPSRTVAGKKDAGAVLVSSCARTVLLTSSNAALGPPVAGGRFGAAVVVADIDRDGLPDVVIGAPGQRKTGAVGVVFGSVNGLGRGKAAQRIAVPALRVGDGFGTSLLVELGPRRVTVGAPGTDVGNAKDAGAVYRITIGAKVATEVSARRIVQGTGGTTNKPERGDRFGEKLTFWLSQSGNGYWAVGIPHEDIGKHKDAGAVEILSASATRTRTYSQDSPGFAGTAEAGDEFGAALVPFAVGVPGESIGRAKHAGAFELFTLRTWDGSIDDGAYAFSGARLLSQASPGVEGTPESGDRLGSSIAEIDSSGSPQPDFAVGVPGEDVGRDVDAGAVTTFAWDARGCSQQPGGVCPTWTQNSAHFAGTAESGDRFGTSVTAFLTFLSLNQDDAYLTPVVGSPGEDVGRHRDAGADHGRDQTITGGPYSAVIGRDGSATGEQLGEVAPVFYANVRF